MIGPKCECRKPTFPSEDEQSWLCMNPECAGFQQVYCELTPADLALIAKLKALANGHWQRVAKTRKLRGTRK
jgi:hypothetical protein